MHTVARPIKGCRKEPRDNRREGTKTDDPRGARLSSLGGRFELGSLWQNRGKRIDTYGTSRRHPTWTGFVTKMGKESIFFVVEGNTEYYLVGEGVLYLRQSRAAAAMASLTMAAYYTHGLCTKN